MIGLIVFKVVFLVFSQEIRGKKVFGAKGILIGEVEGIDFSITILDDLFNT